MAWYDKFSVDYSNMEPVLLGPDDESWTMTSETWNDARTLYENMGEALPPDEYNAFVNDNYAWGEYKQALFDNWDDGYEQDVHRVNLIMYMEERFDLDFDQVFDWDAYREMYDEIHAA